MWKPWSRPLCWLVQGVELITGTTWAQWPLWVQLLLLRIT